MTRGEFVNKIDEKLKLIRTESGLSQHKMADIIGISKKTLVEIEKGRSSLGWTCSVALCTIFHDSELLDMIFGGSTNEIILSLAFDGYECKEKTLGGKVWWKDINKKRNFKVQQNIISKHYRILDNENRRIYSSFDVEHINDRLDEL